MDKCVFCESEHNLTYAEVKGKPVYMCLSCRDRVLDTILAKAIEESEKKILPGETKR